MAEARHASGGIGFWGLLTLLFITLKLTNVIDWSWWWVLSPIWILTLLIVGIFACVLLYPLFVLAITGLVVWITSKKTKKLE